DVPANTACVDELGVGGVPGEVPDGAVRRAGHARDLPRRAGVPGGGNEPGRTRRTVAIAEQHALWPTDCLGQAAAVRMRQRAADAQGAPGFTVVLAEVEVVVRRRQQPAGPSAGGRHDDEAVDVLRAESVPDPLPGLSAVPAPPRPIDLNARPDRLSV